MEKDSKYFMLFSNCIPVKGFKESVVMDLHRSGFLKIPNILYDILLENDKIITVHDLKKNFKNQFDDGIDSYFEAFIKNEYGFLTTEPYLFPKLDKMFCTPFDITTAIINYSDSSLYDLDDAISQIDYLGAQFIQLRLFGNVSFSNLKNTLAKIKESRIRILELFLEYSALTINDAKKLAKSDGRIEIVIHSWQGDLIDLNPENRVHVVKEKIVAHSKEIISEDLFISNIPFYTESLSFNTGLNRKVSIDLDGSIKNFVNHENCFGNINFDKVSDILVLKEFKQLWAINNDKIEKCKDCQFRYMCLSNSNIERTNDKYFKTDECKFDPYENKWN